MNLVFVINSRYAKLIQVLLKSIFINNVGVGFMIYILQSSLSETEKKDIRQFVQKEGHDVEIITVEQELLANVPILRRDFSKEAYYKLLIPTLLPDTVKRVLYMDVDMVVTASLEELYHVDMKNKAIAAVPDPFINRDDLEYKQRLKMSEGDYYFNSGLILFDLPQIRQVYSFESAIEYIQKNGENFKFHDQEVLNALLFKHLLCFPYKYNTLAVFDGGKDIIDYFCFSRKKDLPVVIHYAGGVKPWEQGFWGKFGKIYSYYHEQSKVTMDGFYFNTSEWIMLLRKIKKVLKKSR